MRVSISVFGKFHAHRLAAQMQRFGLLNKIHIAYHKKLLEIEPSHRRRYFPLYEIRRVAQKMTGRDFALCIMARLFDRLVANNLKKELKEGDIFYGWSGYCLDSLKVAKRCGAITFVERSGTHINFQEELLKEEAQRLSLPVPSSLRLKEVMLREYEEADFIVVPSSCSFDSFVQQGVKASKLVKIPLGVDTANLAERPCNAGLFQVLFVGGDLLRKGIYYLLKAWDELKLKNARLVVRGPVLPQFRNLASNPSVMIIKKRLPRRELLDLYTKSSVFCLPSIEDGFGMVVLEAMAAGLPVIISQNVGARDVVRNGVDGFVVPVRDVKAIKEKILLLYEDRERCYEMGKNAREQASRFTWDVYGERMKAVFESVGKREDKSGV